MADHTTRTADHTTTDPAADRETLTEYNRQFIDAFRKGSWALLAPILAPGFAYLDGGTGEVWPMDRYIANLDGHPLPALDFDQLHIHIDGDTAVVSARSFGRRPGHASRYVDTYRRLDGDWRCVHACVWPLAAS